MRTNRASWKDGQSEVRTKISDHDYDQLAQLAEREGVTIYRLTRELLLSALAQRGRPLDGRPRSERVAADLGTPEGRGAKRLRADPEAPPAP